MKKHLLFITLLLCTILTSCKNPVIPADASQKAEIEKQVLGQWEKIGVTVRNSDAESYAGFFSKDGFIGMYSEGTPFLTRQQYIDTVKVWFGKRTGNEVQQESLKVNVLAPDLVVLDQKSIFKSNFKDGQVLMFNHAVSFIFKKEDSGWKIIHGHESWIGL